MAKDREYKQLKAHEFWSMASEAENIALLKRIARLKDQGIDIDGLFDMVDPQKKKPTS